MSDLVWVLTSPPGSAPTSYASFDEAIDAAKKIAGNDKVWRAANIYMLGPDDLTITVIVCQWPKGFIPTLSL